MTVLRHLLLLAVVAFAAAPAAHATFRYKNPEFTGEITDLTGRFVPQDWELLLTYRWSRPSFLPLPVGPVRDEESFRIPVSAEGRFAVPAFSRLKLIPFWEIDVTAEFMRKGEEIPISRKSWNVHHVSSSEHGSDAGAIFAKMLAHLYVTADQTHGVKVALSSGQILREAYAHRPWQQLKIVVDRVYQDPGSFLLTRSTQILEPSIAKIPDDGSLELPAVPFFVSAPSRKPPTMATRIEVAHYGGDTKLFKMQQEGSNEGALATSLASLELDAALVPVMKDDAAVRTLYLELHLAGADGEVALTPTVDFNYDTGGGALWVQTFFLKEGGIKASTRFDSRTSQFVSPRDEVLTNGMHFRLRGDDGEMTFPIPKEALTAAARKAVAEERQVIVTVLRLDGTTVEFP